MRKIKELQIPAHWDIQPDTSVKAKVYKDSETGEYVVKFFDTFNQHHPEWDYYTNDEQDAIGTAELALGLR